MLYRIIAERCISLRPLRTHSHHFLNQGPMRRRIPCLLTALILAGCTKADSTADSSKVALAGAADGPRVVTVSAHDFAFVAGDTITAGMTTFRFINDGPGLHHLAIARLDSGKTVADVAAAFKKPGPPPAWFVLVGGPNAPAPKAESNATFDIAAGNYAILCFVDTPGGVPHFV